MPSILPGYEYDIFISYRHKDNRADQWITDFVEALRAELEATFKEDISIYFDSNARDGLLENHSVDKSLAGKLKCLIFIPIISQTYCDPKSFAWQHELCAFNKLAGDDEFGRDIRLSNGNVASRILPIKIHDIDGDDQALLENELGGVLRAIEFIYAEPGVNRPLKATDNRIDNQNKTDYRNQINKMANAIKAIVDGLKAVSFDQTDQIHSEKGNADDLDVKKYALKIKERDLLKVGLVYCIISLVLWKIVDVTVTIFLLPQQITTITAIALAVLFPISMLFAWKFEKAPSGFIRTNSLEAKSNPFTASQKKPLTSSKAILTILVVMLILYFLPQKFLSSASSSSVNSIENKSIAVLYFDNMSGDPGQDYMSDGLTEEIITRLTKIDGLRVTSRTSVGVYKGQPLNLKKIASDLNVAIILEGSVRRSGNRLRVTAQLINAETDEHLWAETFDRELKDVFEVQTEIAKVIADKFRISMTPEINLKINEISTSITEAYDYYLKARHIAFNQFYYIGDSLAFERSKSMYERAIEIDPEFALAYAGLADLYDAYRNIAATTFSLRMDSLRHSLSWKAYQLNPNSAFVNNVRIWMLINRDEALWDSAFFHANRAIQLEPNDFYNFSTKGALFEQLGLDQFAIPFYEKAKELNPLDPTIRSSLGSINLLLGSIEASNKEFQAAYELAPGTQYAGAFNVMAWLIINGRLDEAEEMRAKIMAKLPTITYRNGLRSILLRLMIAQGKKNEVIKLIAERGGAGPEIYALLDMKKEALRELEKMGRRRANRYLYLLNNPIWAGYQNDPDFKKILYREKVIYDDLGKRFSRYK